MEMSTPQPVSDDKEEDVEEAVPADKFTLDNLAGGFDYSRLLWLLLGHGLPHDMRTEMKSNGGKRTGTILKYF